METEKNKIGTNPINDDASDSSFASGSDSDADSTYTPTPLNGQPLNLKKDYVAHAEGKWRHISQTEAAFAKIDRAHMAFEDLLTTENKILTIDREKIVAFKKAYDIRQEACDRIIEKTKSTYEQYSKQMSMDIDRANQKNLSRNTAKLRKKLTEDGTLLGRSYQKKINKHIKFEEALNSYSIIPIEPSHNVIYQIGVLYHAKNEKLLSAGEFLSLVSIRVEQLPDTFRWLKKEGKIIDLTSDFDALAYQINDYLEEEGESELYAMACQRFKQRVMGIEHENLQKKQVCQALEKLDALDAIKNVETPLSLAGTSGKAEVLPGIMNSTKKITSHFYPLLPVEVHELANLVDIKKSLYLGLSMEELVSDYQKTRKQGEKKALTPSEDMKYAFQLRDDVNKKVHSIEDNFRNDLPIRYAVEDLLNKTQRIGEEYKKKTNTHTPSEVNGNAAEKFFSDYYATLDKKLVALKETLKKHRKKNASERIQVCETEIEKYSFIKSRTEKLKKLVLEGERTIIFSDVSVYKYGASTQVLDKFEGHLEGKDRAALLELKLEMEAKPCLKKEYSAIEELHNKERCLGGDKWKPLTQAFGSYLDRKIVLLTTGNEPYATIDEDAQLVASIEADARASSIVLNSMGFYQPSRKKEAETSKTKEVINPVAMLANCLFN